MAPTEDGGIAVRMATSDLDRFVDAYMPQTKAYLDEDRERTGETIRESVGARILGAFPDTAARGAFLQEVRGHLEAQIITLATRALRTHFKNRGGALRRAIAVLHRKVEALYGDPTITLEILVRRPRPSLPRFAASSATPTRLELIPRGQHTWLLLNVADLGVLLRPGDPKAATERFLERYRAEGSRVLRTVSGLHLFADPTDTTRRPRDYALNRALVDLADYLMRHGSAPDPAGRRRRGLSADVAFEVLALLFSTYFRFVGPHEKSPWEPDAAALQRQYRRLRRKRAIG